MAEPKPRVFEFEASIDRSGRATAGGAAADIPETWKPEDLVLAGLLQCSLTSLRYHAKRAGVTVDAEGSAHGVITRRESDGRFAFVEITCRFDVRLTPPPDDLPGLLEKAERDCFVGASLTVKPRYDWNVT